jgi:hypothetical protein
MADSGSFNSDDQLVVALAAGCSVREAATQAGVSERTAFRRMNDVEFRKRLHEIRRVALEEAIGKLSAAGSTAVDTMLELLKPDVPVSTRLAAARAVLEFGTRLREANDFETRLCELEEKNDGKTTAATASGKNNEGAPEDDYPIVFAITDAYDGVSKAVPPLYFDISPIWRPIYRNPKLTSL